MSLRILNVDGNIKCFVLLLRLPFYSLKGKIPKRVNLELKTCLYGF